AIRRPNVRCLAVGRFAVAGGHSILGSTFASGAERVDVDLEGRVLAVLDAGPFVVLQRHGLDDYHAPHAIDHAANLRAVQSLGCDRVVALSSVGGLRRELGVGTVVVPDDFIALHLGGSQYDDGRGHHISGFDAGWRARVLEQWQAAQPEVRDGGVYWQTIGPRFETAAEIRLMAAHADVVGMTIGAECVVARELDLQYAAVCIVDNLANGVGEKPLTFEEFQVGVESNQERLLAALDAVLPALTET
ncbi:MAG: MTAP family purine nucleoside phosphorylase, partial [Acidimicrobiia bacterium]